MNAEVRNAGPRCVRGASASVAPVPPAVQFEMPLVTEDLPHAQEFERWRTTMGGNWVLEQVFRRSAYFARQFLATKQRVSVRLIWEMVRYFDLKKIKAKAAAEGQALKRVDGYAMNDHFHAHAARFVVARRPAWRGMFEERELQKPRRPVSETTVTVRKFA